jgi:predicted nucleic acid-binding protein
LSAIVVDASVAVKWFVPEAHSDKARQWRGGPDELHAPSVFFDIELANILWKKVRAGGLARADANNILDQLPTLPVIRQPELPHLASAFDLATKTQRTVYDCVYLALAIHLQGRMVTADLRLFNSLQGTSFASFICWVEDVPS